MQYVYNSSSALNHTKHGVSIILFFLPITLCEIGANFFVFYLVSWKIRKVN